MSIGWESTIYTGRWIVAAFAKSLTCKKIKINPANKRMMNKKVIKIKNPTTNLFLKLTGSFLLVFLWFFS